MKEEPKEILPVDQLEIFAIKLYQEKGFMVLKSSVILNAMYWLYLKLVLTGEIKPIEILGVEEKNFYWEVAKRYYTEKDQAVMASKAAYILDLITK